MIIGRDSLSKALPLLSAFLWGCNPDSRLVRGTNSSILSDLGAVLERTVHFILVVKNVNAHSWMSTRSPSGFRGMKSNPRKLVKLPTLQQSKAPIEQMQFHGRISSTSYPSPTVGIRPVPFHLYRRPVWNAWFHTKIIAHRWGSILATPHRGGIIVSMGGNLAWPFLVLPLFLQRLRKWWPSVTSLLTWQVDARSRSRTPGLLACQLLATSSG